MKVRYRDINTGEIKVAKYFSYDYTLNLTELVGTDGTHFKVSSWQLVK